MDLHDLTAAYALDALDPDEADAYERHLGQCEECREQLADLNEAATALAFATVAPGPPARLRDSVLDAAAAERTNIVPLLRRRWVARGLAVAAAAAACVVVGLVVWLNPSSQKQVFTVVVRNGHATLQASGLATAPSGTTYEAWVIPPGGAPPQPAGLFAGGAATTVHLGAAVPHHAIVAVTVEPAGGSSKPTSAPFFSTRT